jgi:hypothetical protein
MTKIGVTLVVLDREKLIRELAEYLHQTVAQIPDSDPAHVSYYAAARAALEFCEARLRPFFSPAFPAEKF